MEQLVAVVSHWQKPSWNHTKFMNELYDSTSSLSLLKAATYFASVIEFATVSCLEQFPTTVPPYCVLHKTLNLNRKLHGVFDEDCIDVITYNEHFIISACEKTCHQCYFSTQWHFSLLSHDQYFDHFGIYTRNCLGVPDMSGCFTYHGIHD